MKKIKLLSKVQLVVLKFLGFFIPYIKRKMERTTILNSINQIMIDHGVQVGFNVQPALEITSNMNYHKVSYLVKLTNGLLTIDLISERNSLKMEIDDDYDQKKKSSDYAELANVSAYFEKNVNQGLILELFENLK